MRKDMDKVQEGLKSRFVEAASGGDLVKVTLNGHQEVVKLNVNPKVFGEVAEKVDVGLLEDLLVAALSQGLEKSKALMKSELGKVAGGGAGGLFPGLF
jgi:DNA-binding protein YbaB